MNVFQTEDFIPVVVVVVLQEEGVVAERVRVGLRAVAEALVGMVTRVEILIKYVSANISSEADPKARPFYNYILF